MFSSKLAKSTDHRTPESRSRTGHLNPGKNRDLQCRQGYKGGCSFGGVMGRGKVPGEECVWGLTTFFRSRETVKSSPEIENQVTSESASVWGQNLEFSGGN